MKKKTTIQLTKEQTALWEDPVEGVDYRRDLRTEARERSRSIDNATVEILSVKGFQLDALQAREEE